MCTRRVAKALIRGGGELGWSRQNRVGSSLLVLLEASTSVVVQWTVDEAASG